MDGLNRMRNWLQTYPNWEENVTLQVDYTGAMPGSIGMYPCGIEELERREDLLGTVTVRIRSRFLLYRMTTGRLDNYRQSKWLQDLQEWVQSQSALGLAPVFGDDPACERITAEHGKLHSTAQSGQAKYTVTVTAEYIKRYQR